MKLIVDFSPRTAMGRWLVRMRIKKAVKIVIAGMPDNMRVESLSIDSSDRNMVAQVTFLSDGLGKMKDSLSFPPSQGPGIYVNPQNRELAIQQ